MHTDLVVQRPTTAPAPELLLLFHGVGSSAEDLLPLGHALAKMRPNASIVSVRSPDPCDMGRGWQWFSVQGVTESNRPERVAGAMPAFVARVAAWQQELGAEPQHTTLIGFSQGAIMSVESTQRTTPPPVAARVIAIAGRFAQAPRIKPEGVSVHLMHGDEDRVMPIQLALDADRELKALGVPSTLDRFANLGHGVDARVVEAIARRLSA
jgi:phospholipase/carboxylesterase